MHRVRSPRRLSIGVLTLMGWASWLVAPSASPATAQTLPATAGFTRIAGADLYGTAASIATSSFTSATWAVLASGSLPYDAGTGNYLAGVLDAPVLLTGSSSLPAVTSSALTSLHVSKVVVVGGTLAVSDAVVGHLQQAGYTVERVAGTDQYQTAAAVATSRGAAAVGTSGGSEPTAIIASGLGTGDIQAVAPMAFAGPFPVLYSDASGLAATTRSALQYLGIRHAVIVGGSLAVPPTVDAVLSSMGITSERVAGTDVVETAARVANFEIANLRFATDHVDVARGDDFADALAGGPHAGQVPAPIILTSSSTEAGGAALAWLRNQCASLSSGHVLGGTLAVSDAVVADLEAAASCPTAPGGGGGAAPPPAPSAPSGLALTPGSAYASVGSSQTVTATVTSSNGPVAGVPVDFFVVDESTGDHRPTAGSCPLSAAAVPASTGTTACTLDASDPLTDAQGQVSFSFHWASPVGQRPLDGSWPMLVYAFTGPAGTAYDAADTIQLADHNQIVWVNAVTSISLEPAAAVVHYSDTAVVRATLDNTNMEGSTSAVPDPDQRIGWGVYRAPDPACTPGSSTRPSGAPLTSGVAYTDAFGTATISYPFGGDQIPEADTADCLFVYYDANGNSGPDAKEVATTGTVTWSNATSQPSALELTPAVGTELAGPGALQTVTAFVVDQYGAAVPGVQVSWSITRDGVMFTSGSATTDDHGQVQIQDASPAGPSLDTVSATSGSLPAASAELYWLGVAASGSYPAATLLGYQSTSGTAGYVDVSFNGTYLRLYYDGNDILKVGSSTVQFERFSESLSPGVSLTADPYNADPSQVSIFTVASTGHGGGHAGGE